MKNQEEQIDFLSNMVSKAIMWNNIPDTHSEFQMEHIRIVAKGIYFHFLQEKINFIHGLIDDLENVFEVDDGKFVFMIDTDDLQDILVELEDEYNEYNSLLV